MEITEFLDARIAEDEAVARAASTYWHGVSVESSTSAEETHVRRHDPDRVLAECAAKRRVVAEHDAAHILHDQGPPKPCSVDVGTTRTALVWPCRTMRILAAVYADHPDFDPAWAVDSTSP